MFDAFLQFEPEMRLVAFGGTLLAILLWEFLATKRLQSGVLKEL